MAKLFDINAIEAQVQQELAEERADDAKNKIKAHLMKIQKAEQVLQTLNMEYQVLLADIATGA